MDSGACSYRRFLDGDEGAFDEIMTLLFDSLVFFLNRYVRDIHAAEDLAIDTFADLIVHPHRYNFKVTLKTYLFMIGRSRALNYIKRRGLLPMENLHTAEDSPTDAPSPEDRILRDEEKIALHHALETLPEEMRAVIHLFYFEEMSYQQIGKILKKTPKQVDNLLYRGKKELRILLGKEE